MFFIYLKYIILIIFLIAASVEDIRTKTIQNKLILCELIAGLILVFTGFSMSAVFDGFLGFLAGGGVVFSIACISKGGIGMGDVKLMACTGLFIGFGRTLGCLMVSIILCGIFGAALLFIKGYNRKSVIPFAPFILIGSTTMLIQSLLE